MLDRVTGRGMLRLNRRIPLFISSHLAVCHLRSTMNDSFEDHSLAILPADLSHEPAPTDPGANPFRLVVDPVMRVRLRRALFDMIESHDQELARYVAEGSLALDSYKEYVEIFASSLKQTMGSREGVAYLLRACGFQINEAEINLTPETRWKVQR